MGMYSNISEEYLKVSNASKLEDMRREELFIAAATATALLFARLDGFCRVLSVDISVSRLLVSYINR